jgi:hypothetical protein
MIGSAKDGTMSLIGELGDRLAKTAEAVSKFGDSIAHLVTLGAQGYDAAAARKAHAEHNSAGLTRKTFDTCRASRVTSAGGARQVTSVGQCRRRISKTFRRDAKGEPAASDLHKLTEVDDLCGADGNLSGLLGTAAIAQLSGLHCAFFRCDAFFNGPAHSLFSPPGCTGTASRAIPLVGPRSASRQYQGWPAKPARLQDRPRSASAVGHRCDPHALRRQAELWCARG